MEEPVEAPTSPAPAPPPASSPTPGTVSLATRLWDLNNSDSDDEELIVVSSLVQLSGAAVAGEPVPCP